MKRLLDPGTILLTALLALAAALPFATSAGTRRDFYFFEVELTSSSPGTTQVFFDVGKGFNESDSSQQPIRASDRPVNYRYMLPTGTLRALRLDPIDREAVMTLSHGRIVDSARHVVRTFAPGDFKVAQQMLPPVVEADVVHLATVPAAGDPIMQVDMGAPVELPFGARQKLAVSAPVFGIAWAALLAISMLCGRASVEAGLKNLVAWMRRHPLAALAGAAGFAVAVQCHPVIFLGKSFVSPDNAAYLLYDRFPTLPGYQSAELEDGRNSDVAAVLYSHLYNPLTEREAVFDDGELPLWNRYDLTGAPLLGQGQSMFGEVFNFLSMAAHSAAWTWDLRFVLAHWLYAFGIALVVYRLTRRMAGATILAVAAPFIGFFGFRMNHPAQFSLCYSPWILVAWLLVRDARGWRQHGWAIGAWILANWEVMTSGTVKEAYMLMVCLNLAGLLLVLLAEAPWRERAGKVGVAAAAGVMFILLSAPLWLSLLDTLASSHSNYDVPGAMQIAPSLFLGFFEDLFYRQLHPNEIHGNPSTNLIVLLGLAWAFARAPESFRQRGFTALGLAALLPLSIVFGVIPASLIVKIPFIANIHHTDNTFSCSLVVLTTVLAGYGLQAMWAGLGRTRWWIDCAVAGSFIAALAALYFGNHRAVPTSAFFDGYIPSLAIALAAGLAGLALWARTRRTGLVVATTVAALSLLLWRHGEYVHTAFDTYVFNPKVRADFRAPSPAVAQVRARMTEPSRPAGLGYNLFSGYQRMLDWEGILGVDALRNSYYDDLAIAGGAFKVRWWDHADKIGEDPPEVRPLQDLFNVRYYLARHGEKPLDITDLKLLGTYDLDVYESPAAWPRAFFTDRVGTYRDLPEFVRQIQTGDRKPFAAVSAQDTGDTLLPRSVSAPLAGRTVRPAHDYRLTANSTSFVVEASGPGVVVLTEAWYPKSFNVTVDGSQASYFRVNHAFKGIVVQAAGTYHVTFTFHPPHLNLSLGLFGAGLLLLGGTAAGCARAGRKVAT